MAKQLFDGTLRGDDRLEMVARMAGFAGAHDAPRDYLEQLLARAEHKAQQWLLTELAETIERR